MEPIQGDVIDAVSRQLKLAVKEQESASGLKEGKSSAEATVPSVPVEAKKTVRARAFASGTWKDSKESAASVQDILTASLVLTLDAFGEKSRE